MRSDLPCRILIGPLGPNLELADGSRMSSSLTHDLCLGGYREHAQLRPFYLDPRLLLGPGQSASPLAPGTLTFGGPSGWRLADLLERAGDFEPELLIWWGFHYALPSDIASSPIPTLLIVSDWHYHYTAVRQYIDAFDHLACDRMLLESLKKRGYQNAFYWPSYGYDPQMIREYPAQRDIDVCFLGNTNPATYPQRNRLLRKLAPLAKRHRILIRHSVPHPDYAQLLSRSRIVFNHALRGEMNLRAYEAAACGALLFQEQENLEVADFLPPGQASVAYRENNLAELINHYLSHEDQRQALARQGQTLIRDFTFEKQFERLLDILPDVDRIRGRKSPATDKASLLEARQMLSTDVPALRARALELLEQAQPAASTDLNALAVSRADYEALLLTGQASYAPKTDLKALVQALLAQKDLVSLNNAAWIAFQLQDWPCLEQALAGLGQVAESPLDPDAFWLPLRLTPLHTLRQRLRQQLETDPPRLQAELRRLLGGSLAFLAGNLWLAKQDPRQAESAFLVACTSAPAMPEGWFEAARCAQARGDLNEAVRRLEAGLNQGIYYPPVWPLLIQLLMQNNQFETARERLLEAMVLFQDPRWGSLQQTLVRLRSELRV